MPHDGEIKYFNQCFQCLKVIKPRAIDTAYTYGLRRYCGRECVAAYQEAKRKLSGRKN